MDEIRVPAWLLWNIKKMMGT